MQLILKELVFVKSFVKSIKIEFNYVKIYLKYMLIYLNMGIIIFTMLCSKFEYCAYRF